MGTGARPHPHRQPAALVQHRPVRRSARGGAAARGRGGGPRGLAARGARGARAPRVPRQGDQPALRRGAGWAGVPRQACAGAHPPEAASRRRSGAARGPGRLARERGLQRVPLRLAAQHQLPPGPVRPARAVDRVPHVRRTAGVAERRAALVLAGRGGGADHRRVRLAATAAHPGLAQRGAVGGARRARRGAGRTGPVVLAVRLDRLGAAPHAAAGPPAARAGGGLRRHGRRAAARTPAPRPGHLARRGRRRRGRGDPAGVPRPAARPPALLQIRHLVRPPADRGRSARVLPLPPTPGVAPTAGAARRAPAGGHAARLVAALVVAGTVAGLLAVARREAGPREEPVDGPTLARHGVQRP